MNKWQAAIVPLLLVGTIGCGQNHNASQQGRGNNNQSKYMEVKQSVQEPDYRKRQNLSSQDIAKHLVQLAEGVPKVKDATAIVTMGYAVVGIDVDKDVDRSRVGTIKYSVTEAMKHDRYGANAVVIADPDAVQRLKNMGKSIKNGRPVSGVLDELSQIVARVAPQIPNDMRNGNRPSTPRPQTQVPPNRQPNPQKQPNRTNQKHPGKNPKKQEFQATP